MVGQGTAGFVPASHVPFIDGLCRALSVGSVDQMFVAGSLSLLL